MAATKMAGVACAQYPIMDRLAEKVVQKCQSTCCDQRRQEHGQKAAVRPEMEERVVRMLRHDPPMRQAFLSTVAAPIVDPIFECGMIP